MPGGLWLVRGNAQLLSDESVEQRRLTYIRLSGYCYGAAFFIQLFGSFDEMTLACQSALKLYQGFCRR